MVKTDKPLVEYISEELAKNGTIKFSYRTGTTSTNHGYINVYVGLDKIFDTEDEDAKDWLRYINLIYDNIRKDYPNLDKIEKNVELHFYYHGFNMCCHNNLPVEISTSKIKRKEGKVTLNRQYCRFNDCLSIIEEHPDYELYLREGFGFRGAQERKVDKETMMKAIKSMCCADVKVVDDEIHINTFSINDMY